jgi:hypothetical protein
MHVKCRHSGGGEPKSGTVREKATGIGSSVKATIDYLDQRLINYLDHSQQSRRILGMEVDALARVLRAQNASHSPHTCPDYADVRSLLKTLHFEGR